MILILKFCLLFSTGTILGWGLEVIWRRFFGLAKRWLNPGFLNGPWLPLYGFGTVLLFLICSLNLPLPIMGLLFLVLLTTLELLVGIIFRYGFKINLWDYSKQWGNIKGLICPLYSLFWTALGFTFYFIAYPLLQHRVEELLIHLEFSFFIGIYAGIFLIDIFQSFHLASQIKIILKESNERLQIDFENYKLEIRDKIKNSNLLKEEKRRKLDPLYLLPFRGESLQSHREGLKQHIIKLKKRAGNLLERKRLNKKNDKAEIPPTR